MTTLWTDHDHGAVTARTYELTVAGQPSLAMAAAFDDFEVIGGEGRTILRVQLDDQAALHGAIARLQALGLELLDVRSYEATGSLSQAGGGQGDDGVIT